jgi:hypothetical protein
MYDIRFKFHVKYGRQMLVKLWDVTPYGLIDPY